MRTPWLVGALAAALAVSPLDAQESYRLGSDAVSIYNLAGSVEVVEGSGSDVVVEVRRGGADADALEVEVDRIDGREALRILYPADRVVYSDGPGRSSTDVRVRDDGTFYDRGGRRGRRVQVRSRGSGLEAHADLTIRVPAGRDVAVYLAVGESTARGLDADLRLDQGSGAAEVIDVRGRVMVDTGSGDVRLSSVEGPEVEVDTGSGEVSLERIRADEVRVDTGSGAVEGMGILAGALDVDTGSGSIELTGVESPNVVCDTGSGSVRLAFDTDVDRVEIDTGSGSITLRLPESAGAALDAETGSGPINVDLPIRLTRSERRHIRGSLGDGEGRIHLDTGSGGIRIEGR